MKENLAAEEEFNPIDNIITPRLKLIADLIEKEESVLDLGTDHGYLPVYLRTGGNNSKIILSDISKASLKKAKHNCRMLTPSESFDFRQGNGLKIIKKGEVDDIVIAGIGGNLMTDILGRDLAKARAAKKLILQPRTAQGRLRQWLIKKGFGIKEEHLVKEGRFICEVIVASYFQEIDEEMQIDAHGDSILWEMPSWLVKQGGGLLREYIEAKLERERRILRSMGNSKNITKQDLVAVEENIRYLESCK